MRQSCVLIALLWLLALGGMAYGGTDSETQYTYLAGVLPETLSVADSPFMVLADIQPQYNGSTYVEPGVEVLFTAGTSLLLSYTTSFECAGTVDHPVVLHDAGLGEWGGIRATDYGPARTIVLRHALIQGATNGIYVAFLSSIQQVVVLDTITVSNCTGCGISLAGTYSGQYASVHLAGIVCTGDGIGFAAYGGHQDGMLAMEGCEASNNGTGLSLGWPMNVTACSIHGNGWGLKISSVPPTTVTGCSIHDNSYGFEIDAEVIVNSCSIENNGSYDVFVEAPVTSYPSIDFRNNDWGPTTTDEMDSCGTFCNISTIHDWWDDHTVSIVDYYDYSGGSTGVPAGHLAPTTWSAIKKTFR